MYPHRIPRPWSWSKLLIGALALAWWPAPSLAGTPGAVTAQRLVPAKQGLTPGSKVSVSLGTARNHLDFGCEVELGRASSELEAELLAGLRDAIDWSAPSLPGHLVLPPPPGFVNTVEFVSLDDVVHDYSAGGETFPMGGHFDVRLLTRVGVNVLIVASLEETRRFPQLRKVRAKVKLSVCPTSPSRDDRRRYIIKQVDHEFAMGTTAEPAESLLRKHESIAVARALGDAVTEFSPVWRATQVPVFVNTCTKRAIKALHHDRDLVAARAALDEGLAKPKKACTQADTTALRAAFALVEGDLDAAQELARQAYEQAERASAYNDMRTLVAQVRGEHGALTTRHQPSPRPEASAPEPPRADSPRGVERAVLVLPLGRHQPGTAVWREALRGLFTHCEPNTACFGVAKALMGAKPGECGGTLIVYQKTASMETNACEPSPSATFARAESGAWLVASATWPESGG